MLLVATAVAPAGVAAQDEDNESFFDGLVAEDGTAEDAPLWERVFRRVLNAVSVDRTVERTFGDSGNASEHAAAFQNEFNANNDTIVAYANERLNATTTIDVIKIEFQDKTGGNATVYLVSSVDTGNESFTSARIVNSTDRPVDHSVTADWYVSRHATAELDSFISEYAEPGEDIGTAYRLNMLRKYGSGINGTLWGG